MKIAVVGPTDPDSFADNVAWTLERMGHEVLRAGPGQPRPKSRVLSRLLDVSADAHLRLDPAIQMRTLRAAFDWKPDLVITVDKTLHRRAIARFHASGAIVVLWFPDAVPGLGNHEVFQSGFDRLYFKNSELVKRLREIYHLPARYLPEAFNSDWHVTDVDYGTSEGLVIAGNIHPTRARLIERLHSAGIPVRVFGPRVASWVDGSAVRTEHQLRGIYREEKSLVFRSATAVLNNLHPAEYQGSNCRLFEATGSGALVLTEWRSDMEPLFLKGEEVLGFHSFDELLRTYRRAAADPEWANRIADAGRARAVREHTYAHRLTHLLNDAMSIQMPF